MKKTGIFLTLALALAGASAFTSCNDEKDYPPVIVPADYGSGTWDSPVSVSQIIGGFSGTDVWVCGYIVGWIDTGISNAYTVETVKFETPATVASNMLLASSPDERDIEKCIAVQLVAKTDARTALNLVDNPGNLGKQVSIKGNAERYFGRNGFKNVTLYNWGDKGIYEEPAPDVPTTTGEVVYSADKSSGLNAFTFEHGNLPAGISYVWSLDPKYGLKATAFVSGARYATDALAISPVIDLTGAKTAKLTFRHAGNYFDGADNFKKMCTLRVRQENASDWTETAIPEYGEGASWNFGDSGDIDLSSFAGKKIQIAFRYTSTAVTAGTWEVDKIEVSVTK